MTLPSRLKSRLFSFSSLLTAAAVLLPLLALCAAGILWLLEHDYLLIFIAVTAGFAITTAVLRWVAAKLRRRQAATAQVEIPDLEPNPQWNARETAVFASLCKDIHAQTQAVLDWPEVQKQVLYVIEQAALQVGGAEKNALDFTTPEALLLVEQTAKRYRRHLREKIPFSDQVSIAQIRWFWRNRKRISTAWKLADAGRRLARLAANPSGALIRELETLITGGESNYFSEQMVSALQSLLLEEVAATAIDLYSGRLRFSDDELRQVQLQTETLDEQRSAVPTAPLRVLIVGQVSAGKSSFINSVMQSHEAETDVSASTVDLTSYSAFLDEFPCTLVDSPGIDGTASNRQALLAEMTDSDMLVWLLRADRPSRSADLELYAALNAWYREHSAHRPPAIVFVVTHIDRLIASWPFPEHELPAEARNTMTKVRDSVAQHFAGVDLLMASAAEPSWNIANVYERLCDLVPEAVMAQKNRRRLGAESDAQSLRKNMQRGAKGLYFGARALGQNWWKRQK